MAAHSHEQSELYVGVMSGTSADGVDAVVADFSDGAPRLLSRCWIPYPEDLRAEALALNASVPGELDRSWRLGVRLSVLYAQVASQAIEEAGVGADRIAAIGCHGQTIRHQPEHGYTIQLCHGARIAELVKVAVVNDFRSRDVAAGGQGAPLVPAFHAAVFRDATAHRVIVNLGGIANLTDLPPSGPVHGFDTGPANALLDDWSAIHLGEPMDREGRFAARGTFVEPLLAEWLSDAYFKRCPPKSTGREYFSLAWLRSAAGLRDQKPEDVQATLVELSARSLAAAIDAHCPGAREVYLCGGGVHNPRLFDRIRLALQDRHVDTTAALGIDPDWVEALAFAWLARACLRGEFGNVPEVTGAAGPRVLGAIYPA